MTEKLPTIDIKGKQYVLVKDRIIAFHELNKNGAIKTELCTPPDSKLIVFKALVMPDIAKPERIFTGYSQAIVGSTGVNATAALENAETSAVGRALAMMGIGVLESVASADEVKKASYVPKKYAAQKISNDVTLVDKLKPCDKCGKKLVIRNGKNGQFVACSGYPECKRSMDLEDAQMWLKPEFTIAQDMGGEVVDGAPPITEKDLPF